MDNTKKYLKLLVYALITFTFVSCLFVFKTWIFPFITSKTIPFRICIELLSFVYLILMFKYEEYKPKKSWILYSVLIFTFIAIITSIFGLNPYLSFTGDLERMWGISTWVHLVLFFLVLTNFLKTKKEWFAFFNIILVFCSTVAVISYLQIWGVMSIFSNAKGLEGVLGNIAYIAGLTLLGALLSLYYLIEKKEWWFRILYLSHIIIQLPILMKTQIRGAQLALYLVLFLISFIFIFKSKKKFIKIGLLIFVIFFISIFTLAFLNKEKDWVKKSIIFNKMTSISKSTGTVRTRLISWNGGLQAIKEKPFIGYGMENYYYAFDKHFQADYYNIAAGETWFDRAHNMVMETLVAHGIFGLIFYLSIFVITLFCLYKTYKANKEKNFLYYLFFSCIVIAYFIQNFFVFDSLAVTSTFFFILAYINFRYTEETGAKSIWQNPTHNVFNWIIISVSALVLLFMIFNVNAKQMEVASQNYVVQKSLYQDNDFNKTLVEIKKLYEIDSYLNKDSTTMLTDTITSVYGRAKTEDQVKAVFDIVTYLIEQSSYYLDINEKESYMQMNSARLYMMQSMFFAQGSKEYLDILELAKKKIEKSIELSPERLHNYYFMANIEMMLDNIDRAISNLETALKYNDKYADTYLMMGQIYGQKGDVAKSEEYIKKAIELNPSLEEKLKN